MKPAPLYAIVSGVANEEFRIEWTEGQLIKLLRERPGLEFLDVGAGSSPFREIIEKNSGIYHSHDFNLYTPTNREPGIQNDSWNYAPHTYVCDILKIPTERKFDVILCTEVLEHVPDPVSALKLMSDLLVENGTIVCTVPYLSLMHQAPYWFSSGLSPFWFLHWSKEFELEVETLLVAGDFIDLLQQEIYRVSAVLIRVPVIRRVANLSKAMKYLRPFLPHSLLQSGGFGTFYIGKKNG